MLLPLNNMGRNFFFFFTKVTEYKRENDGTEDNINDKLI